MEQRQLGQAAGRAELSLRPFFPFRQAERFSPFGKIELTEEPRDPDIDGKGIPATVCVEQHTAGNFRADSREFLEVVGGPFR